MRVLNKRQKKMLDEWFATNWTGAGSISGVEDVPATLYEKLESINDHETIWQNINRYIMDKIMDKLYS